MLSNLFKWWLFANLVAYSHTHRIQETRPSTLHGSPNGPTLRTTSVPAAVLRLRGGEQAKTGKTWVASTFTRDHIRFMVELPYYLGAYLHPFNALDAKDLEEVMVTVNTVNTCPYCTGLHGELARMASADNAPRSALVTFAKIFAEETGRGDKVKAAFKVLVNAEGLGRAKSTRALCWALHWGKTTGNSINCVRSKILSGRLWTVTPFDLIMFLYYGPLFAVIGLANAVLKFAPEVGLAARRLMRAGNGWGPLGISAWELVGMARTREARCRSRLRAPRTRHPGQRFPATRHGSWSHAGARLVLYDPWRHPLGAPDALHPATRSRQPGAPCACRAVWWPRPLKPQALSCLVEERRRRLRRGRKKHASQQEACRQCRQSSDA